MVIFGAVRANANGHKQNAERMWLLVQRVTHLFRTAAGDLRYRHGYMACKDHVSAHGR